MSPGGLRQRSALARVLVVAHGAADLAVLCEEMVRRGASLSMAADMRATRQAISIGHYDAIIVHARDGAPETLLLLQLIRAMAAGQPRILLLVDPECAQAYAAGAHLADAMLSARIAPEQIAEAAGVETRVETAAFLPTVVEAARRTLLALPSPMSEALLPEGVRQQRERGQTPDLVLLVEPSGVNLITSWMSAAAAAAVPVVDASGRAPHRADASLATLSGRGLAEVMQALEPMVDRFRQLPESYFRTRDARAMLLARLAVRDRGMKPERDPSLKSAIRYSDEQAVAGCTGVAESLLRTGHMTRRFFDRLHSCRSCQSARLNVREECFSCRSADINERAVIHHLRCGYQGPESDFEIPGGLKCPKCRLALEHFSVDYDKPATLFVCSACAHATGDAAIGFVCLDCETHHDGDKIGTRTVYAFELSETGREAAFAAPIDERGDGQGELTPRERVKRFVRQHQGGGREHCVIMIRLDSGNAARLAAGERLWLQATELFATVLREMFKPETEIVDFGQAWLVLIDDESCETVQAALPELRAELEKSIAVPLGARYDVFSADQLTALLEV